MTRLNEALAACMQQAKDSLHAEILTLDTGLGNTEILAYRHGDSQGALWLAPLLESYYPEPTAQRGTVEAQDLTSFVQLALDRMPLGTDHITVYANEEGLLTSRDRCSPVVAVLNPGASAAPSWEDNRVTTKLQFSDDLKRWLDACEQSLTVRSMVQLLEQGIANIIDPPELPLDAKEDTPALRLVRRLQNAFSKEAPKASALIPLLTQMRINQQAEAREHYDQSNGSHSIAFEQSSSMQGGYAAVPTHFFIEVELVKGTEPLPLIVRLTWEVDDKRPKFQLTIMRLDKALEVSLADWNQRLIGMWQQMGGDSERLHLVRGVAPRSTRWQADPIHLIRA